MKIFSFLYAVSFGAWITTLFISIRYNDSTPMWIALIIMNVFNALRIFKEKE